jgi:hypothetical protein
MGAVAAAEVDAVYPTLAGSDGRVQDVGDQFGQHVIGDRPAHRTP